MTEQENNLYFLRGKLEHHFKNFLSSGSNLTHFENFIKNVLEKQYSDDGDRAFISRLLQELQQFEFNNYENKIVMSMRNICINNLNNEMLIRDLLNYVDMTRNYEFEEKIENLQKDVVELKNINLEQSIRLDELSIRVNNLSP